MIQSGMVLELEATQAQIQRILQSKTFRTSEVHRNLLTYLADKSLAGGADALKEYTIGLDVFAKPDSYDPRQESTVRMHVGRLRQKLAEYYRTEGEADPIIVDLPKGGFKVTFEPRSIAEPIVAEAAIVQPAGPQPLLEKYRREMLLAAFLAVAIAFTGFFSLRRGTGPAENSAPLTPELRQLWDPILSSNRPLLVCLSVTAPNNATGVGAASGAFLLGQFLGHRKDNVLITRSDTLSVPELSMGDVVFLGPPNGSRQIQSLPGDRQLVLETGGIRNLNPRSGEPAFLPDQPSKELVDVEESHTLISRLPGLNGNGELLYISGNTVPSVLAGVQALTDPALARTLVSKLKSPGGKLPRYYQMVLDVKSMDDMPVEIVYGFHRELSGSASEKAK
jgi:hypothetical protein